MFSTNIITHTFSSSSSTVTAATTHLLPSKGRCPSRPPASDRHAHTNNDSCSSPTSRSCHRSPHSVLQLPAASAATARSFSAIITATTACSSLSARSLLNLPYLLRIISALFTANQFPHITVASSFCSQSHSRCSQTAFMRIITSFNSIETTIWHLLDIKLDTLEHTPQ